MAQTNKFTKSVIAGLLKPFVRFCLRRDMRIQDMIDVLKFAMLHVAEEKLDLSGDKANISRLSVLTGLQRKEIRRLSSVDIKKSNPDLLTKIIGQWQSNNQFLTKDKKPRALTVTGNDSEFFELVKSVSVDVSPYTVLFGLEKSGAVKRSDSKVTLLTPVYISSADEESSLTLLAEDTGDLVSAVEENIFEKPDVPNLHLSTVYDNITEEKADELREWILDQGTSFQEKIRNHLSKFDKDANPRLFKKEGGVRIAVGTFSYCSKVNGEK